MPKNNVLFIIVDSLRSDALSINGNPICKTPNLDALAEDGCSFKNCFAQNPVCAPSRAAILTGWYPHVRGHRTFTYHIQPDEENLLKYFKRDGYLVKAAGTNDCLHENCFPDSIDEWLKCEGGTLDCAKGPYSKDLVISKTFLSGKLDPEYKKDRNWDIKEKTVAFLKEKKNQPWFFYSALHIPHPKYGVPEPWYSMYDPNQMPIPAPCEFKDKPGYMKAWHEISNMDKVSPEIIQLIRAVYYGMVSLTDHYVGEIINALKESGEYDNTTIVFLSDHGDYTGDFGLIEKCEVAAHDCIVNVPLIVKPSADVKINSSPTNEQLCETIDVLPTLLEINDIQLVHNQYGKSLLSLLKADAENHKNAVFFEGGYNPEDRFLFNGILWKDSSFMQNPDSVYGPRELYYGSHPELIGRFACVRTREWKYVQRSTETDELYDLINDPEERINCINNDEHQKMVMMMKDRLLDWYLHTSDSVSHTIDDRLCAAAWTPEKGLY